MAVLRPRAAALQGSQGRRLLPRSHARGDHHRHRAQDREELQAAADQPLPDPDEVPRRNQAPVRLDARPRVHHEGRLFLPRGRCRRGPRILADVRGLQADLHAPRRQVPARRGRQRRHRRQLHPRVPRAGGQRRRRDPQLQRVRVHVERRENRSTGHSLSLCGRNPSSS